MDNFSNKARTWFAAQRGFALCSVTTTAKPALAGAAGSEAQQQQQLNDMSGPITPIHQLGFTFAHVVGPAMAAGRVISTLAYTKSAPDLKQNIRAAIKLDRRQVLLLRKTDIVLEIHMLSLPTLSPILFCPDEHLDHIYILIRVRTQFLNLAG